MKSEFVITQRVWDLENWIIIEYPPHSDDVIFRGLYPTKEEAEIALAALTK